MRSIELSTALRSCRSGIVAAGFISGAVNILYLSGSFFMLQVYDRVLPSRSLPTLVGLLVLVLALYTFQGALDAIRARILSRIGSALDQALSQRMLDLAVRGPLKGMPAGDALRPLRDLDAVRGFLGGSGPNALFDLPWIPVYLAVCTVFHPLIGLAGLAGTLVLVACTVATDRLTAPAARRAAEQGMLRLAMAETVRRNAEPLSAMGMQRSLEARWAETNRVYMAEQMRVSDVAGGFGAASKAFRAALQSGVLALGAFLVINGQATAGIIIAASILTARAMAPAEQAIAHWKGFVQARDGWRRLHVLCARVPVASEPPRLPAPCRTLSVESVSVAPPGTPRAVAHEVALTVGAGHALGIIGPSASGKSSLARALVGVWPCLRGRICLDGAALDQWTSESLGPHIGYLPQEVELFPGTIAQNIARFRADASSDDIIEAAEAAGVHTLILGLPNGYATPIGEGGSGLSSGQRQRIGLARALFGKPFLVVLDEPNANLDSEGDLALTRAILGIRMRGGICVVVAHRPSALAAVDLVLVMADGTMKAFGPKDEVLRRTLHPVGGSEPQDRVPGKPGAPSPLHPSTVAGLQQGIAV